MKKINELNLNELSNGLSQLISEQIGGQLDVTLQKFERTKIGYQDDRLLISFSVKDEDWAGRMVETEWASSETDAAV